jgi:hypothetical protein
VSDDLQDLKKKLQLKRREKEEEKPTPLDAPADGSFGDAAPADDFSLPFQSGEQEPSEQARAILEARAAIERGDIKAHKVGLSPKKIAVLVLGVVVLFGAGLSFGKVFRMREIENQRIDEALALKAYFDTKKVSDGSVTVIKGVEAFKAEVERMLGELDDARKAGKSPEQMKDRITAFLDTCLAYVMNQTYFPEAEVYPVNLVNSEALSLTLPVVVGVHELFLQAATLAELGEKIKRLEAPKSATSFAVLVSTTKETVKAKTNPPTDAEGKPTGESEIIDIEVTKPAITMIEAAGIEENPLWGTATDAEKKAMEHWFVPYKGPADKEWQAGKTSDIGAIDASAILQKKDAAFANAAVSDVAQRIYSLRETVQRVNFKKLNEFFDKTAARDKYITL